MVKQASIFRAAQAHIAVVSTKPPRTGGLFFKRRKMSGSMTARGVAAYSRHMFKSPSFPEAQQRNTYFTCSSVASALGAERSSQEPARIAAAILASPTATTRGAEQLKRKTERRNIFA
jgi:hypothetical protein